MKAIITAGISASGKSTYAKTLVEQGWYEVNRDWIRFNIVNPGGDWSTYKFNNKNESQVTEIHNKMIMEAAERGDNLIVSDTNLNQKRRDALISAIEDLGYTVEVKAFQISLQEAVKRDNLRANGVGQDVIYKQYLQMNEFLGRKVYVPDESLPKVVIFDIDGTVAEMVDRGPFEWSKVGSDKPREFAIEMLKGYSEKGYHIVMCSGRSDECYGQTVNWLNRYIGCSYWDDLFMRKAGDFRKDSVVKEEIFWQDITPNYNVVGVVDDRPTVLKLYLELSIPNVISVGNPYINF